jgi:hypothetical protein
MNEGFSTRNWAPLQNLKETEDSRNPWLDDSDLDLETTEGIWAVLDPRNAPEYLTITIGSETEEFLFQIDLTGATPVLQHEDGRILYIRKKGGVNDVERTNQRAAGKDTQAL